MLPKNYTLQSTLLGIMSRYKAELHANNYYHIYNRTNNKELLFRNIEDRKLFLKKYSEYVLPYVDTFVFCLLGNHFHFLIKVKNIRAIVEVVNNVKLKDQTVAQRNLLKMTDDCRTVHKALSSQFTRLFTSYALWFKRKYSRDGNLFYRPFKRILVESENHFTQLIYYIHANPQIHGIEGDFKKYKWSSYSSMLSLKSTNLKRKEVLNWFGGREYFLELHNQFEVDLSSINHLMIED
ncbi:MAG: transposase [Chitinophagales bacterium]